MPIILASVYQRADGRTRTDSAPLLSMYLDELFLITCRPAWLFDPRGLPWENCMFRSYSAQSSSPSAIQRQEFNTFQDGNTTFGKRGLPLTHS